jgi:ribosomal protein S1
MSEMSFEQMLEGSLKSIHAGEIVTGKVISVKPDEIALNIGYKSDGIMTRNDYSADNSLDLTTVVNVGDEIECKVKKVNDGEGQVVLSHREALQSKASEELRKAFEEKTVLTGKVVQVVKGGLNVEVDGARVFVPASLVSDTFERDLTKYQGQDIKFIITEFNPQKRRVIGDRKQLMLAEKKEMHDKLFSELKVGDVRTGVVKNLTDFGAFIDLGGADGLLHISEMSWGRIENPKKLFKPGQEVKVLVKEINDERIALTRKFPEENPWKDAETKYAVGSIVQGKVARMTDFGAFIELDKGIDALLHVSQISREHVNKPSDVLEVGQDITAKVVDLDVENHKISLSIKALLPGNDDRKEDPDVADVDIEAVGQAEAAKTDAE